MNVKELLDKPVRDVNVMLGEKRELPVVKYCNGAYTSEDKGRDAQCCCNCQIIRNAKYRGNPDAYEGGWWICNKPAFEFVSQYPPAKEACHISRCNQEKPMIFFYWRKMKISVDVSSGLIKEMFKLRHQMKLVEKSVKNFQIGVSKSGLPVVFPNSPIILQSYGGDEGVEFSDDKKELYVVNLDEAFKSGKWMYLINYYQTLQFLPHEGMPIYNIETNFLPIFSA